MSDKDKTTWLPWNGNLAMSETMTVVQCHPDILSAGTTDGTGAYALDVSVEMSE